MTTPTDQELVAEIALVLERLYTRDDKSWLLANAYGRAEISAKTVIPLIAKREREKVLGEQFAALNGKEGETADYVRLWLINHAREKYGIDLP